VVSRNNWEVIPDGSKNAIKIEPVALREKVDVGLDLHSRNFVDVIKNGNLSELACPIQAGALVAMHAHMGNISYRVGDKINWDAAKGTFDNKTANALIKPVYHNGFVFPS
jgi:hypothetical protein